MQDLIQQLKNNAGITHEQAIKVLETMQQYLQGKVPPMFSGFVNKFFADSAPKEEDPLG